MTTLDESVATFYKVKHETHHLPHGPGIKATLPDNSPREWKPRFKQKSVWACLW